MIKYTARYAHSDADIPGDLELSATNDAEAITQINALVGDGYRNGSWANVTLADGTFYRARNEHGKIVSRRSA